jgi:hypothetical protein
MVWWLAIREMGRLMITVLEIRGEKSGDEAAKKGNERKA